MQEMLSGPPIITPHLIGRGLLLVTLSIMFWMSVVLTVFAPIPLALLSIILGRSYGHIFRVIALGVVYLICANKTDIFNFFSYLGCVVLATGITESYFKNYSPIKAIILSFMSLFLMVFIAIAPTLKKENYNYTAILSKQLTIFFQDLAPHKNLILEQQSDNAPVINEFFDKLSKPDIFAKEIIYYIPVLFIISLLIPCWPCAYFVYRYESGPYSIMNFKVPEINIYLLIPLMLCAVLGESYIGIAAYSLVLSGLMIYAVFYFFQGIGILHYFVGRFSWPTFLKAIFLVMTVYSLWPMMVLIGLFDTWANFRRGKEKLSN